MSSLFWRCSRSSSLIPRREGCCSRSSSSSSSSRCGSSGSGRGGGRCAVVEVNKNKLVGEAKEVVNTQQ
eukprot:7706664-Prorocentrum_lima.AAC.1